MNRTRVLAIPGVAVLAVAGGIAVGGCGSDSSTDTGTAQESTNAAATVETDEAKAMKEEEAMKHEEAMKEEEAMKHEEAMKEKEAMKEEEAMKHEDAMKGDG